MPTATLPLPDAPTAPGWGEMVDGADLNAWRVSVGQPIIPSLSGRVKAFPLHRHQRAIMTATARGKRFLGAIAGTGGGKTALGPVWLMEQIERRPAYIRDVRKQALDTTPLFAIVAPTYGVLNRATVPKLVETFAGTHLEGVLAPKPTNGPGVYLLPPHKDGTPRGKIWLLAATNADSLEGGQHLAIWCDEAGQFSYEAWIALRGRTGVYESPILMTTTPYSHNWLETKIYNVAMAGDPDYYVRVWSSCDNPAYSVKEYEAGKASMSSERAAMRYDGKFSVMSGLVLPDLRFRIVKPYHPPQGYMYGGMDFGYEDPFAALAATLYMNDDGDSILYVWYERYKRHLDITIHEKALPRGIHWAADPSNPESIATLRRGGHTVTKANNSIIAGIDHLHARINSCTIEISEDCKALIWETQRWKYRMKADQIDGQKPDPNCVDHACDALRYLVMLVDHQILATAEAA